MDVNVGVDEKGEGEDFVIVSTLTEEETKACDALKHQPFSLEVLVTDFVTALVDTVPGDNVLEGALESTLLSLANHFAALVDELEAEVATLTIMKGGDAPTDDADEIHENSADLSHLVSMGFTAVTAKV